MFYNEKSLCVRCTHMRPALDPNIQKAYLGKCTKREWPFTLAITLQGWSECDVFQDSGKAYVPPDPAAADGCRHCHRRQGGQARRVLLQQQTEIRRAVPLRQQQSPGTGQVTAGGRYGRQGH